MIDWRGFRNGVDPAFAADIDGLLGMSPYRWTVTYGRRTRAEQSTLYAAYRAGGPRAASPGNSAHEYGLAVDVALDKSDAPGLQPEWTTTAAGWTWLVGKVALHPRLKSLWYLGDYGHIEAVNWRQRANAPAVPIGTDPPSGKIILAALLLLALTLRGHT